MPRMMCYSRVIACWALLAALGPATPATIEDLERPHQIDGLNSSPQLTRSCESSTNINGTLFQNPEYPSVTTTPICACKLKVYLVNKNICQIRLDFIDFSLAQPNREGVCEQDFLQVTGGVTNIPLICGNNSGQHLYMDVIPGSRSVNITVHTSTAGAKWNISVTQIKCNAVNRAPAGCLQYFTNTFGTIKSFNSPYDANPDLINTAPMATTQLANQTYSVCIKSQSGFCSIAYRKTSGVTNDYSFSLSGDPAARPIGTIGSVGSTDCTTDYLIIPNGIITDVSYPAITSDRYCGVNFPSKVESQVQPFVLYVVTDETETNHADTVLNDGGNAGFSISYRIQPC
ncbi:uncharacterized protein LOC108681230 [Hyalella azteca]|uniref:Uncharacterized protein LOC108681230 n=1 Tax=Hyalella azteca TaxID=294128 RepID=A0A8B7PJT6_HYAAZ|nr:uncharacterized protein LOC108681230 [Hyalella azteca]